MNAFPPVLAQVGLDVGGFLGGVVVVEQVFNWPGI
jgi:ABC-type dipeptide/oligopeptide/nickel transport system permease component